MRVLFFALFMVLIPQLTAAASPPESGGQAEQAKPEQHQQTAPSPPPVSQPPVESADKPENTNPPCKAGEDNRNSDLCAQWKAADAAQESADWARRSFWLVIVGSVIGFLTLIAAAAAAKFARDAAIHTEAGARAANKALEHSSVTSQRELRAYVTSRGASVKLNGGQVHARVEIVNTGQTPAKGVQSWIVVAIEKPPFDEAWLDDEMRFFSKSDLGAGGELLLHKTAKLSDMADFCRDLTA